MVNCTFLFFLRNFNFLISLLSVTFLHLLSLLFIAEGDFIQIHPHLVLYSHVTENEKTIKRLDLIFRVFEQIQRGLSIITCHVFIMLVICDFSVYITGNSLKSSSVLSHHILPNRPPAPGRFDLQWWFD